MIITTWGTRGSLPRAMTDGDFRSQVMSLIKLAEQEQGGDLQALKKLVETRKRPFTYGGNTSCVEIQGKSQSVIVDMGTGLRGAGTKLHKKGVKEYHIFLTHLHWDHIMGLPFFLPLYDPSCTINLYFVHKTAPEYTKILFNGHNFPLNWSDVSATVNFVPLKLYTPTHLDDLTIHSFTLDHPGGSFGYRVEQGGRSMVVGYDSEYKRISQKDLGRDLEYYQNLDLILFDAQYEMQEYATKFDWGHCTPTIGTALALREGIKHILLTHHDPWALDETIFAMLEGARKHVRENLEPHLETWKSLGMLNGPEVSAAFDGAQFNLEAI